MTDDLDDLDVQITEPPAGSAGATAPVVFMRHDVLQAIEAHAHEDLEHELGGILLGAASSSAEGTLISVDAAVPALHTDASRGSVTFTHDTWEEINRIKDRDYPGKRIVGWYHTHPGFGLFLSEYDLFIHRNFFNLPWQTAFVVDPRANTSGFFVWSGEEIEGPSDYHVFGPGVVSSPGSSPAPVPSSTTPDSPAWRWIVVAALAAILLLQLVDIRRTPAPGPPADVTVAELPPQTGPALQAAETAPKQDAASFTSYTVKRGDSLWRIAKEKYGNGAKWGAIAIANGIEADDIEPEMILRIPNVSPPEDELSGE